MLGVKIDQFASDATLQIAKKEGMESSSVGVLVKQKVKLEGTASQVHDLPIVRQRPKLTCCDKEMAGVFVSN